jgi:hypothetical protein
MKTLYIIIMICIAFTVRAQIPDSAIFLNAQRSSPNTVILNWTAKEFNHTNFIIERSVDGQSFNSIGELKTTDDISNYSFTDRQIVPGIIYYRLRQTGTNGELIFSNTIMLNNEQIEITNLFIREGSLNVEIYSPEIEYVELLILDISGTILTKETVLLNEGYNAYTYSGKPDSSPRIHVLRISDQENMVNRKFMF